MAAAYSPSHALRLSKVEKWDGETDVIVVGFGVSGACAAIEARQTGAAVTIFEVAAASGGSSALSGGEFYLGGGTWVQTENGFEDDADQVREYLTMSGGPGVDRERVNLYAANTVSHFQWLQDQGIPFKGTYLGGKQIEPMTDDTLIWSGSEAAFPFTTVAKPAPRGHAAQMMGMGAGKLVMEKLTEKALSLGVEAHFSTRVLALIADDDNAVHGIVVRIDGEPKMYRARKGVVLCAGGFICNEEMLKRFAPEAMDVFANPTTGGNDDGSGIRMGMSVGGAVTHMAEFFATKPSFPPDNLVRGIFVNERGQRFINEDAYHGRVTKYIMRQPNGKAWLLMDNAIFERPLFRPNVEISAVGETWAELEAELGIPEGELQHTVEAYNRYAEKGEDPILHKDAKWMVPLTEAPFAALSYCADDYPATGFTLGGLVTTTSGEVLDAQGAPIKGLYAAGRTACGIPRWGEAYASGMSLGDSSFYGRQAGIAAAKSAAR